MVAGTWELRRGDGKARIELRPFTPMRRADRDRLSAETERLLALVEPRATTREVTFAR
jgi:hypothetical protein